MNCPKCKSSMRTETRDHEYRESGLPGVTLEGIEVEVCEACGHELVTIPAMGQLHRALAQFILDADYTLNGAEIRFLRKHLGLGTDDLAARFGVTEAQVDRWESGDDWMTPEQEAKLRASVANKEFREEYVLTRPPHRERIVTARRPGARMPWGIVNALPC